jgi:hypothetical protein
MTVLELPLSGAPVRYRINLGGAWTLTFQYRDNDDGGWMLDIGDADNAPVLCGIPLVTGSDLLAQYAYLGFTGQLWVRSDGDPDAVPSFFNLGSRSHVYWIE